MMNNHVCIILVIIIIIANVIDAVPESIELHGSDEQTENVDVGP